MSEDNKANLAVIGIGAMGSHHLEDIGSLENARLVAVCDIDRQKADRYAEQYQVDTAYDYHELLDRTDLDGVVIATPHYDHTPISIDFLKRGTHVLTEKPIAVTTKDARKMIAAYDESRRQFPGLVFEIMFMQRTYGSWRKIKEILSQGELGRLVRATWIITDWFRTQSYYDNGGWRATWKGEGGGVLINQCPHNLDLYQWFFGVPERISGFASLGKYHNIEVEDDVSAFFEHANGMTGQFISSTAESPGTNRLEIIGENGKLIFEDGKLSLTRNRMSMLEHIRTSPSGYDKVENMVEEVAYPPTEGSGHKAILENFANAILYGEELIAPAAEGLNSLLLSNGIMLSTFKRQPIQLPYDEDEYANRLTDLAANSRYEKHVRVLENADFSKSF